MGTKYLRDMVTPEEYIVKLIGQFQVNDRLRLRLSSTFKVRPITFNRIRKSKHLRDLELYELERLLKKLVRESRIYCTDGLYYLPSNIVSF